MGRDDDDDSDDGDDVNNNKTSNNLIIAMKMTGKKKIKRCTIQLLTIYWLMLRPSSGPLSQLPPGHVLSMMFCSMEYPFGQFMSTLLPMLPWKFSCTCSLAELAKQNGT